MHNTADGHYHKYAGYEQPDCQKPHSIPLFCFEVTQHHGHDRHAGQKAYEQQPPRTGVHIIPTLRRRTQRTVRFCRLRTS